MKKIAIGFGILLALAFLWLWQSDALRKVANNERFLEVVGNTLPTVPNAPVAPALPFEPGTLIESELVIPDALASEVPDLRGRKLFLPEGWTISVFAAGLRKPRMMGVNDRGILHVTAMDEGVVWAIEDKDADGVSETKRVVLNALKRPSGIVFDGSRIYVADENRVIRFLPESEDPPTTIVSLPGGGNHVTRTLAIKEGKLYVSVGSSCNACEDDPDRAAVLEYNLDGSGKRLYARGLRNTVGLIVGPDGSLWGTDNGRDRLGDDLPPEEVNEIKEGKDYGWPYCYGARVPDPEFGSAERCEKTAVPDVAFQAHTAPLGLRFLDNSWGEMAEDLLVATHGSWNRSTPVGYNILRMSTKRGGWNVEISELVTGWRLGAEAAWGRPVDLIAAGPKALYISDDKAGVIYLLRASP